MLGLPLLFLRHPSALSPTCSKACLKITEIQGECLNSWKMIIITSFSFIFSVFICGGGKQLYAELWTLHHHHKVTAVSPLNSRYIINRSKSNGKIFQFITFHLFWLVIQNNFLNCCYGWILTWIRKLQVNKLIGAVMKLLPVLNLKNTIKYIQYPVILLFAA